MRYFECINNELILESYLPNIPRSCQRDMAKQGKANDGFRVVVAAVYATANLNIAGSVGFRDETKLALQSLIFKWCLPYLLYCPLAATRPSSP